MGVAMGWGEKTHPFHIQLRGTSRHRSAQAPEPSPSRLLLTPNGSEAQIAVYLERCFHKREKSQTTSIQDIASFLLTFMNYVFHISGAVFHKITSVIAGSPWKVLSPGFTSQI